MLKISILKYHKNLKQKVTTSKPDTEHIDVYINNFNELSVVGVLQYAFLPLTL